MDRTLSAPGKLFLAGEYAVLWGGVARVLAVGPRSRLVVRRRADRKLHLLTAEGRLSGDATPLGVRWEEPPPASFRFAARTVDLALRALNIDGPGLSIAFEPSSTFGGKKLGLGSSARTCVLTAEACRTGWGATFDSLKLALVAHASAQDGKGSGADVAACFAGELVRYQRAELGELLLAANKGGFGGALDAARPVEVWRVNPPRLPMLFVFSGQSASTPSLIGAVEQALTGAARTRFVLQSDLLGSQLEEAAARGDFAGTKAACTELQALLFSLGPTRTDALERILALAEAAGCTAKQSGAGGGDGCLVFAPDLVTRDALRGSFESRGLGVLPIEVQPGVRGEGQAALEQTRWIDALS